MVGCEQHKFELTNKIIKFYSIAHSLSCKEQELGIWTHKRKEKAPKITCLVTAAMQCFTFVTKPCLLLEFLVVLLVRMCALEE